MVVREVRGEIREQETGPDVDAGPGEYPAMRRDGEVEVGVVLGVGPRWGGSRYTRLGGSRYTRLG